LVSNAAVCVVPERIAEISRDANTVLFVCEHQGFICATALLALCADVMLLSAVHRENSHRFFEWAVFLLVRRNVALLSTGAISG
jgi:hypothetical protein